MLDPEIEAERRLGIAATDAAPICGLSTFKSAADVWLEKKKPELLQKEDESPELYWGKLHEPLIADEYAKRTGVKLEMVPMQRNQKLDWLMCQPDRVIVGKQKGVECKTAGGYNSHQWGPHGTDIVPVYHLLQVQHSMMVTGWKEWDVPALIGGNDFRIYHLWWNSDLIKELFEIEREFYLDFILGNKTPPIDWGKNVSRFASMKWPKHKPDTVFDVDQHGDDVLRDALLNLVRARDAYDAAERAEATNTTLVQSYMKDNEALWWASGQLGITWKTTRDGVKVDWKAVADKYLPHVSLTAEEKAAIIKEFTEEKPGVRRFLVKDKKEKS